MSNAPPSLPAALVEQMTRDALIEAQKKAKRERYANRFYQYADDPVAFANDILGEDFTDPVKKVMQSVVSNRITIAKSGNATGKSHMAARIALWFFMVYPDAQVFTTSAPPVENLKTILWGEILSVFHKKPILFKDHKITALNIERGSKSFLKGVAIPMTGSEADREAKFCADADDLFEMTNGEVVRYGDLIGKSVPVISVATDFSRVEEDGQFFDNGVEDVYEITLASGQVLRRTGGHPLYVGRVEQSFKQHGGDHVKGRYRAFEDGWQNVNTLKEGSIVLCPESTSFAFGTETMDPDEIKVLAYLIGDGSVASKSIWFIQKDPRILSDFTKAAWSLGSTVRPGNPKEYSWRVQGSGTGKIGSNPILNLVKKHGLFGKRSATKFIPESVFRLRQEDVALFLSRLFATDGWASLGKTGKYLRAEIGYTSKSAELIDGIQRLLLRFGIRSKLSSREITWEHKGEERSGLYWTCSIWASADILRFAEFIGIYGKEEAVENCAEYARERGSYASWKDQAPEGFVWERIRSIINIGPRPTVGVTVPGNQTYLTNVLEHNSGKHSPHLLFIVDEGDAVPEEVYKGIESCMSGGHTRLLILFNPRDKNGSVYQKEINGQGKVLVLSALEHPNVITGRDVIPGAVNRETTVRRINEWTREQVPDERVTDEYFEVPDFLVGATAEGSDGRPYPPLQPGFRKVVQQEFWYMVMGRYPAQSEHQLIAEEWILKARQRWDLWVKEFGETSYGHPIMGVDIAELGSDSNVACFRYGNFVAQMRSWSGLDIPTTADKCLAYYREMKAERALIDGDGIGAGVAPLVRRSGGSGTVSIAIKVSEKPLPFLKTEFGEFYQLRDQLWWACREWLRTEQAMLPPDPELMEELMVPRYAAMDSTGKIKVMRKDDMRKILKRSPDRADALIMTFAPQRAAKVIRLG